MPLVRHLQAVLNAIFLECADKLLRNVTEMLKHMMCSQLCEIPKSWFPGEHPESYVERLSMGQVASDAVSR